jgi:hypothetical protein
MVIQGLHRLIEAGRLRLPRLHEARDPRPSP